MKYKIAIFDLDGTILDTLEDLCDTTNYALTKHNMVPRTIDEVRCFVGNGIHRLIELAVEENTSKELIEDVFKTFNEHYKIHSADKTKPYDGIIEAIKELKNNGVLTAVVSNKADYAVKDLCQLYFKDLFDYTVGEKEGVRRKPYPDSVNATIDHFNLNKKDAIYIGDSEVDYQTSVNAEVDVIMVTWGFREEDFVRSFGATNFVHTPNEIVKQII